MDEVISKMRDFSGQVNQEKIYLHIDKSISSPGETIWYKGYLVDAYTHYPSDHSSIIYIELVDLNGQIIINQEVSISNFYGDLTIPNTASKGIYTLRAYTSLMCNFDSSDFFEQRITVVSLNSDISETQTKEENPTQSISLKEDWSVLFYPEGGDLINGLESNIAFHVKGADPENLKSVQLKNKNEVVIDEIKVNQNGYGSFRIRADINEPFYLELEGKDKRFSLPNPVPFGYSMNVARISQKSSLLMIKTNMEKGLKDAFVIIQSGGEIYKSISLNTQNLQSNIKVRTADLPNGICHITLFRSNGEPVAERLIYLSDPDKKRYLEISLPQESFSHREKIKIDLALENSTGINGDFSCSIVKANNSLGNNSMESYLMLHSELENVKADINGLIDSDSAEKMDQLDLIMLTHGWRRFVWKEILAENRQQLNHPIEKGFTIAGNTTKIKNKSIPIKSHVYLTTATPDGLVMRDVISDANGAFEFNDLNINSESLVVIQANVYNQKKERKRKEENRKKKRFSFSAQGNRDLEIHLNPIYVPPTSESQERMTYLPLDVLNYTIQQNKSNQLDSIYSGMLQVEMDELVIEGRRSKRTVGETGGANPLYDNPSSRYVIDSIQGFQRFNNVFELLRREPGVTIIGTSPYQQVLMRGPSSINLNNAAVFFLNGIEVDASTVSDILMDEIASVDVYKGAEAAVFGLRGGNGVISINTRAGTLSSSESQNGIIKFIHSGYYKAREFQSPNYSQPSPDHQKPDYRTTLYWNPNVTLDHTGHSSFEIYANDLDGDYIIRLEGLTIDGIPLSRTKLINIHP